MGHSCSKTDWGVNTPEITLCELDISLCHASWGVTIHSVTQRRVHSWGHWEVNLPEVTSHGGLNTPDHVAWGVDTASVTQTRICHTLGWKHFWHHTQGCAHSWCHSGWGEATLGDTQIGERMTLEVCIWRLPMKRGKFEYHLLK